VRKAAIAVLPLVLAGCASGSQVASLEQYQEGQWRATNQEFEKIWSYYRGLDQRLQHIESSVNRIEATFRRLEIQEGGGGRYIGPPVQTVEPIR